MKSYGAVGPSVYDFIFVCNSTMVELGSLMRYTPIRHPP